jgi:hypothetical protein
MVGRWWRGATEDSHSFIHSFLQKYAFLIRARLWWVLGIMIFNADMGAGEKVVREGISEDIDSYIGYDNDSRNATALKSLNLYIDLTYIVCVVVCPFLPLHMQFAHTQYVFITSMSFGGGS